MYRASTFLLNQLKVERSGRTPYQFAIQIVDKEFNTSFTSFMNIYLKTVDGESNVECERRKIYRFVLCFIRTKNKIKIQRCTTNYSILQP